ncbi:NucA/NucB deoxyribonuclease domain-containing protein [Streptomyces sp. NPDC006384]|uniref:NucA/NucB deoxyribonuclease domain-containing protein n=1 Tax=Streptomyces sp. NPDC006384 TaxID=3364745 RepID=UPI0036CE3DFD
MYAANGLNPRPDTSTQQCDEFPFRATREGAASADWDFSVRAVTSSHNSSAGGMLPWYFRDDRILAWDAGLPYPDHSNDKFYVRIAD